MRYDYKIILLLINNKWKITHAYGYRPLQNGYLERPNVYLNDTITQNVLGEALLIALRTRSTVFFCKSSLFESGFDFSCSQKSYKLVG